MFLNVVICLEDDITGAHADQATFNIYNLAIGCKDEISSFKVTDETNTGGRMKPSLISPKTIF